MTGPGRVAPHNLQAEEALLGAMLLARDAIAAASEVVRPADFYRPAHVHIYDAILTIYGSGDPVDPVTVGEALNRLGVLDLVGGEGALVGLQANAPAISNAGRYARIVEELAVMRRMIGVGAEVAELGYQADDVDKALDAGQQMMFDLSQHRDRGSLNTVRHGLEATLDALEARYERGERIVGTPTGFLDYDEMLSGLKPSELIVIGARPGQGKTSWALNAVAHAAVVANRPVLFFSLEMSELEINQRLLCSEARVDATRVRNGKLSEQDWEKISNTVGRLADAPIWIDDNPNVTVMEIRSKARKLKAQLGDLGMVVVDYVQLMTGRSSSENRQVEIAEISRSLKILAREIDVPVVALAQLNRGLEQRADKRPLMSDLRESGALEQDADVVTFLYRDEVYHRDSTEQGVAEVIVAKNRNGPTGVCRLAFLGQYTRFANMARS